MSLSTNIAVTKLRGRENYDTWKRSAQAYLTIKGYWKWTSTEITSTSNATDIESESKARAELNLLLDESLYSYVDEDDSTKKQWEALKTAFADSGLTRKVSLLQQLVSLKLVDCESMEEYINKSVSLWTKVKRAGFNIDEEVIGSLMLGGLPSEFTSMVMAIENSGKKITVDSVRTLLLQDTKFEMRDDGAEKALAAKARGTNFVCHECKQHGHIRRNCPNRNANVHVL